MSAVTIDSRWKLGQGMCSDENILDPVTFDDLILALKCNYDHPNEAAVLYQAREIIEQRLEDYNYLIENNIDEILAAVNEE